MARCRPPTNRLLMMRKKGLVSPNFQKISNSVCAKSIGQFVDASDFEPLTPFFTGPTIGDGGWMDMQGSGVGTPSSDHAGPIDMDDYEGNDQAFAADEPVWKAGRVVTNYLTFSNSFGDVSYIKQDLEINNSYDDPDGGNKATRIKATASNGRILKATNVSIATDNMINSVWIKRISGTGNIGIFTDGGGFVDVTAVVTTEWQRINVDYVATVTNAYWGVNLSVSVDEVAIYQGKVEKSTNRADPITASEYLKTEASPVTRVNAYENGNSVTDNVVTEGQGELISRELVSNPGVYNPNLFKYEFDAEGDYYARFNGVAGQYVSTPDSPANSITGDIDIRVKVAMNDWTPAAQADFITKFKNGGGTYAYEFRMSIGGTLQFQWSEDGIVGIIKNATTVTGITDGEVSWIRATFDVDNGAAGSDVKFYKSSNGTDWAQIGATVTTAGTTSIADTINDVEIGSWNGGTNGNVTGSIYQAQIYNGIDGTLAVDFNAADNPNSHNYHQAPTGEVWTWTDIASGRDPVDWSVEADSHPMVVDGKLRIYNTAAAVSSSTLTLDTIVGRSLHMSWSAGGTTPRLTFGTVDTTGTGKFQDDFVADATTELLTLATTSIVQGEFSEWEYTQIGQLPPILMAPAAPDTVQNLYDLANHSDEQGGWFADCYMGYANQAHAVAKGIVYTSDDTSGPMMYDATIDTQLSSYDGVNVAIKVDTWDADAMLPNALVFGDSKMVYGSSGGYGVEAPYDGGFTQLNNVALAVDNDLGIGFAAVENYRSDYETTRETLFKRMKGTIDEPTSYTMTVGTAADVYGYKTLTFGSLTPNNSFAGGTIDTLATDATNTGSLTLVPTGSTQFAGIESVRVYADGKYTDLSWTGSSYDGRDNDIARYISNNNGSDIAISLAGLQV